ncbi:hypothetical protein [Antrihabitans sp. YC2-6]|uniref:hypothetical protein n=1 Tax=Antrihabitans sp. YC2-6 TaxID=2799498 RepID=UPI0018F4ADE4|nr:hypothetical protein [Antrihabitans sp. YC2-6]MBJ8348181.1 hypothetical protein [Antrihabitans sp. YC2-6]
MVLVRRGLRAAAAIAIAGFSTLAVAPAAEAESTVPLNGLFALSPGVCSGGAVSGSFFRMILPTGDASGPFLSNSDSGCSDQSVTPLSAGSDGGLLSGSYQPQPAQAFDGSGNATSGSVTTPVRFYGVGFATATNPVDPQTGGGTALPQIFATGNVLSGDLSALGVTWNNQVFNQGSPKPGGGLPGKTSGIRGTIDPANGSFVIEWTSQIVGGPFNNFTGLWHLAGQYRGGTALTPAAGPAPAAPVPGTPAAALPAAPPATPAPGGPVPDPGTPAVVPAAQPAQSVADPALAARTIDVPREHNLPIWVIPALVVGGLLGVALFFSADRIAGARNR